MPDNSVPLLTPQTLLNIAVLVSQHEASLWHDRTPAHSSVLTGSQYVNELLSSGNPTRIFDVLRMPLPTFFALRDWCIEHDYLQPTQHISVEEQLAIFLKIVGENTSNRMVQERFQRSGSTISRGSVFMVHLRSLPFNYSAGTSSRCGVVR